MTGGVDICCCGEGDKVVIGGNTGAEKLLAAEGVVKLPPLSLTCGCGVGGCCFVGDRPPRSGELLPRTPNTKDWEAGVGCGKTNADAPASAASDSAFFVDEGEASCGGGFDGEIPFPFPANSVPLFILPYALDMLNDTGGDSVGCGDEKGCFSIPLGDNLTDLTLSSTGSPLVSFGRRVESASPTGSPPCWLLLGVRWTVSGGRMGLEDIG